MNERIELMKRKNRRPLFMLVLAVVLSVGFMSCDLVMSPGQGTLEIHLGGSGRSINWLPEISMDIATYTVTGTGPNAGDGFLEEGFTGGTFTKDSLAVGAWEIAIDAYNGDGGRIGTTTIGVTIRRSQTTQASATIIPLAGVGTLDVSVSWSDSQDKLADPRVFITIRDGEGDAVAEYPDPIQLALGEDGKSAIGTVSDIPTGWYEVTVGLYEGIPDAEAEAVWQDVYTLRIVKDETTDGTVVIPEQEIDFGVGSIAITVEEEMDNPFDVSFTGLPESVKEEEQVTAVAAGTYGDGATYRWYVNGAIQPEDTDEYVFSSDAAGLYRISLLVRDGEVVGGYRRSLEVVRATAEVASDTASLEIGYAEGEHAGSVMNNLVLPTSGAQGTRITWESNDATRIDTTGTVARPSYSSGDSEVQLTATVERGTARETKTFTITVVRLPQTDAEAVAADKAALEVGFAGLDSADNVTQDVTLVGSGGSGTTITWESSVPQTVATTGVVTRPDYTGESDVQVTLTATISKGGQSETKTFTLTVKIVLQEQSVTYESNGGSNLPPQTVYWGRLVEEPEEPTKVGHSFEGWYTDTELTDQWDFAQDHVNGDVFLYAKWGDGYRISFDSQGGLNPNPTTITVGYGLEYGALATTARVGHTFLGWYTELDGRGVQIATDTTVSINAEHTLYAAWQANTQTITFDAQEGTDLDPATKVVTYGQVYGGLASTTREGYTFAGWWTGVGGTGSQVTEETVFTGTTDRILYAKWTFDVFTGPAGGLVFYENPNHATDGWRYLEAAPYGWYDGDTHSPGAYSGDGDPYFQWGASGYAVDSPETEEAIGSGATNTANILDYHDTLWTSYPEKGDYYTNPTEYDSSSDGTVAAKVCADYSLENEGVTYDDWFLPSKDELNLMYQNLKVQGLGGLSVHFYTSYYYWSSTKNSLNYVWYQNFANGYQNGTYQGYAVYWVRPIRAF
jgi:uncharacterized repeat protein (TIGR02543 family)